MTSEILETIKICLNFIAVIYFIFITVALFTFWNINRELKRQSKTDSGIIASLMHKVLNKDTENEIRKQEIRTLLKKLNKCMFEKHLLNQEINLLKNQDGND